MLIKGNGLIISLPARELTGLRPSGSVFEEGELRKAALSDELTSALAAIKQFCALNRLSTRFLARPEIFTHGEPLAWLHARLGGIKDHLCLSDGYAVRPIPSMRNHLFLYRQASHESALALQELNHRAPELLGSMTSQVNTAMVFGQGAQANSPPSVLLQTARRQPKAGTSAQYYSFAANPSIETSVTRTLATPVSPVTALRNLRQLTYAPITSSACHDPAFARIVADLLSACLTDASRGCVIQLPDLKRASGTDPPNLKALVQTLQSAKPPRSKSPGAKTRATAKHRPVMLLTDADWIGQPPAALPCPVALALHSSYGFWKHPREHYSHFHDITVYDARASSSHDASCSHAGSGNPKAPMSHESALRKLLGQAFARKPKLQFLQSPHQDQSTKPRQKIRRRPHTTAPSSVATAG